MMKWFSNWLARSPAAPRGMNSEDRLADLMAQGRRAFYDENYDQAFALFEEAWKLAEDGQDPTAQADVLLHQADVLIVQKRYEAAETLLRSLEERCRSTRHRAPLAYTLVSLGIIASETGQRDQAVERYEEAAQIAEEANAKGAAGRARAHLGEIYLLRGNVSYALRLLRLALIDLEQSGDTELVSHFMQRLAEALEQNGEAEQALELMQRGLERATSLRHKTFTRQISAALAERLLNAGEAARARDLYRQALGSANPETLDPHETLSITLGLAKALAALHDPEAEILALNSEKLALALKAPSQAASACAIRAQLHAASERYADALQSWEAALNYLKGSEHPDALSFRLHRARMQAATERIDEAIEAIKDIQSEARRSNRTALETEAAVDLARLYEHAGDWQMAIHQCLQAIRLCEGQGALEQAVELYCVLAELREWMGQSARSAQDIRQALTHLPQIKEPARRHAVLLAAARSLSHQGDHISAEAFFQESLEIAQQTQREDLKAQAQAAQGAAFAPTRRAKEAITLLQAAQQFFESRHQHLAAARCQLALAQAFLTQAQFAEATQALCAAWPALEAASDARATLAGQLLQARIALESAQFSQAEALFQQMLTDLAESPLVLPHLQAQLGLAELALAQNRPDRAGTILENLAPALERSGNRSLQARCALLQSRLASMQGSVSSAQNYWQNALRLHEMLRFPLPQATWLADSASANVQDS